MRAAKAREALLASQLGEVETEAAALDAEDRVLRKMLERRREALVTQLTATGRDAAEVNSQIDSLVDTFISNYDGRHTRVVCELVQRAGTHGKATRCRYLDEPNYPGISLAQMR